MKQRLTAKEEEVMNILWKSGESMFIRDIVAAMPEPRPNYNTVATQVRFLEEKGFVVRRPMANSYQYSVAVSEREYRGQTVGDVVSRYYGNSYTSHCRGRGVEILRQFLHQSGLAVRGGGEDGT